MTIRLVVAAPEASFVSVHHQATRWCDHRDVISRSALRGYVLEELLAGELQNSGFSLLVDPAQDPLALSSAANGLRVRGRGADHQADALGELNWDIPFSLPVRLFLEAKYQESPVGISAIRNALGVINDVNEHYSIAGVRNAAPSHFRRYHYRYSIFSASGFTTDAEQFAYTQQISHIDLSAPAHGRLLRASTQTADRLLEVASTANLTAFPVNQMREAIRRAIGTWTLTDTSDADLRYADDFAAAFDRASTSSPTAGKKTLPAQPLAAVAAELVEVIDGSLYFATTSTPFLIVTRREAFGDTGDNEQFVSAPATSRDPLTPTRPARLAFTGRTPSDDEWALVTSDHEIVRFNTTPSLERAILTADSDERSRRDGTRTITVMEGGAGTTFTFEALDSDTPAEPRRTSRRDPRLIFRDENEDAYPVTDLWSWLAVQSLLRRLRDEKKPQASVIVEAARRGGRISREDVYEIAGYPQSRSLRGFTKPPRRIANSLIAMGQLDPAATPPLVAVYKDGVLASHFQVPREFVDLLD